MTGFECKTRMKSRLAFDLDTTQAAHPISALRLSIAVGTDYTCGVPRWRRKAHVTAEGYGFVDGRTCFARPQ